MCVGNCRSATELSLMANKCFGNKLFEKNVLHQLRRKFSEIDFSCLRDYRTVCSNSSPTKCIWIHNFHILIVSELNTSRQIIVTLLVLLVFFLFEKHRQNQIFLDYI